MSQKKLYTEEEVRKATAVQWLLDKECEILGDKCNELTQEQTLRSHYAMKKALQMEKEQIMRTARQCHFEGVRQSAKTSEEYIAYGQQYYNETYGGQGSPDTKTSPNTQNK